MLNDIYTENYYITLVNNIDLDSITGLDKDLGFAELEPTFEEDKDELEKVEENNVAF